MVGCSPRLKCCFFRLLYKKSGTTQYLGSFRTKKREKKKLKTVTVTVTIWAKAPFFHSGRNCKSMQKQWPSPFHYLWKHRFHSGRNSGNRQKRWPWFLRNILMKAVNFTKSILKLNSSRTLATLFRDGYLCADPAIKECEQGVEEQKISTACQAYWISWVCERASQRAEQEEAQVA